MNYSSYGLCGQLQTDLYYVIQVDIPHVAINRALRLFLLCFSKELYSKLLVHCVLHTSCIAVGQASIIVRQWWIVLLGTCNCCSKHTDKSSTD